MPSSSRSPGTFQCETVLHGEQLTWPGAGRGQCEPGDAVTAEGKQASKHYHPAEAPTG